MNWTDIWSGASQPELGKAFTYNFANVVAIDPSDHLHLLLDFPRDVSRAASGDVHRGEH